jgi:hypothetical protein
MRCVELLNPIAFAAATASRVFSIGIKGRPFFAIQGELDLGSGGAGQHFRKHNWPSDTDEGVRLNRTEPICCCKPYVATEMGLDSGVNAE